MRKMIIDDSAFLFNQWGKSFAVKSVYWVICILIHKRSNTSNFFSDSPMTAMVLVFLVRAQCIDKYNCQNLVKLS